MVLTKISTLFILLISTIYTCKCDNKLNSDSSSLNYKLPSFNNNIQTNDNCFCVGVPGTPYAKAPEILYPKGGMLNRLVVFFYQIPVTNKIVMYTPGPEKQTLIPDLPFEDDDQLNVVTTETVYKNIIGNPYMTQVRVESNIDNEMERETTDNFDFHIAIRNVTQNSTDENVVDLEVELSTPDEKELNLILESNEAHDSDIDLPYKETETKYFDIESEISGFDIDRPHVEFEIVSDSDIDSSNVVFEISEYDIDGPHTEAKPVYSDIYLPQTEGEIPYSDISHLYTEIKTPDSDIDVIHTEVKPVYFDIKLPQTEGEISYFEINHPYTAAEISDSDIGFLPIKEKIPYSDINFPDIENKRPNNDINLLQIEGDKPYSNIDFPHIEVKPPYSDIDLLHIEVDSPHSDIYIPNIEVKSPHSDIDISYIDGKLPYLDINFPYIEDTTLYSNIDLPHIEHKPPYLDFSYIESKPLYSDIDISHKEVKLPYSNIDIPHIESKPLYFNTDISHTDDKLPYLDINFPYIKDKPLYSNIDFPYIEHKPTYLDFSYIESKPLHSDIDISHEEVKLPYPKIDIPHIESKPSDGDIDYLHTESKPPHSVIDLPHIETKPPYSKFDILYTKDEPSHFDIDFSYTGKPLHSNIDLAHIDDKVNYLNIDVPHIEGKPSNSDMDRPQAEDETPYFDTNILHKVVKGQGQFNKWFLEQMHGFNAQNNQGQQTIDLNAVGNTLLQVLYDNGLYVTDNGLLINSYGTELDIHNLNLRPVLIGDTMSFGNLFQGNAETTSHVSLPYLQAALVTTVNPTKILGIVPFGKTYLPHSTLNSLAAKFNSKTSVFTEPTSAADFKIKTLFGSDIVTSEILQPDSVAGKMRLKLMPKSKNTQKLYHKFLGKSSAGDKIISTENTPIQKLNNSQNDTIDTNDDNKVENRFSNKISLNENVEQLGWSLEDFLQLYKIIQRNSGSRNAENIDRLIKTFSTQQLDTILRTGIIPASYTDSRSDHARRLRVPSLSSKNNPKPPAIAIRHPFERVHSDPSRIHIPRLAIPRNEMNLSLNQQPMPIDYSRADDKYSVRENQDNIDSDDVQNYNASYKKDKMPYSNILQDNNDAQDDNIIQANIGEKDNEEEEEARAANVYIKYKPKEHKKLKSKKQRRRHHKNKKSKNHKRQHSKRTGDDSDIENKSALNSYSNMDQINQSVMDSFFKMFGKHADRTNSKNLAGAHDSSKNINIGSLERRNKPRARNLNRLIQTPLKRYRSPSKIYRDIPRSSGVLNQAVPNTQLDSISRYEGIPNDYVERYSNSARNNKPSLPVTYQSNLPDMEGYKESVTSYNIPRQLDADLDLVSRTGFLPENSSVKENDDDDGGDFRIIGGNAATGSGTPLSNKGRSGFIF